MRSAGPIVMIVAMKTITNARDMWAGNRFIATPSIRRGCFFQIHMRQHEPLVGRWPCRCLSRAWHTAGASSGARLFCRHHNGLLTGSLTMVFRVCPAEASSLIFRPVTDDRRPAVGGVGECGPARKTLRLISPIRSTKTPTQHLRNRHLNNQQKHPATGPSLSWNEPLMHALRQRSTSKATFIPTRLAPRCIPVTFPRYDRWYEATVRPLPR